jgi:general stress protein 26
MYRYYPLGALDPDFALINFTAERGNLYMGLPTEDFEII